MKDHSSKQASLSERCNKLCKIKVQQKLLKRQEKELKTEVMKGMINKEVLEDAEGKIEKVSRKPKRTYVKELLETELRKYGLSEIDITSIIKRSTKRIEVSEYLSVTPKHKKR